MKIFLKGLYGCALRRQKLVQYNRFLKANNHEIVNNARKSDVTIIWTCAFRTDVRDYSISEIIRYKKEFDCDIIVAGCLPDIAPELLKQNFSGYIIPWRNDKELMEQFFGCDKIGFNEVSPIFAEQNFCDNVQKYREENPDKDVIFPDQFIKVLTSEGCRYKCSYCSERLAFPPFKSFPQDKLVDACRKLVEKTGKLEVILLGDCVGDYGIDIGTNFPTLIRRLKTIHPGLKFALNNFNPISFIQYYDDMLTFFRNGYFIHLNLPIQSASPQILKLMNRPYTRTHLEKIFGLLNKIGFKDFDTHIIIGFPGETEEDIDETCKFILRYKPRHVMASSYMEVPGLDSSKLSGKVDPIVINQRMHNIVELIKKEGIICNSDESDLIQSRFKRMSCEPEIHR
ncbi:conserved hypothetical protein [Candidatus Magnetomoraceae bacterium gMMP-15]